MYIGALVDLLVILMECIVQGFVSSSCVNIYYEA